MKNYLLLFAFLGVVLAGLAQDDTYSSHTRQGKLANDTTPMEVMVIPASLKMYRSIYDEQMCEANGLKFAQLRDTVLMALTQKVAEAFADTVTSGVIPESRSGYVEDMDFVYESILYTHELVPEPQKNETTVDKWKKKFKKKDKPEPQKGTYMENGQIVNNPDTRPKYTNIDVVNPDFLFVLNKRNRSHVFVCINQYEMAFSPVIDHTDLQSDNYPREIKVHFTILDENGKELTSGLVVRNSSSFDNKLEYLFNQSFSAIGSEIRDRWLESLKK